MTFRALLVSENDEALAVLTPALSGFGVGLLACGPAEGVRRLTDEKFDALIVDFDDANSASILQRRTDYGPHAVTVALLADKTKVREVIGAGAHFILYKPLNQEQAEAGLRAAASLIKRERRRSYRVPVQAPLQLQLENGPLVEGILLDLSEEGMDVLAAQSLSPHAVISTHFNLPDGKTSVNVRGEVAWANPNGETGVCFSDVPEELRRTLKSWVAANARGLPTPDSEAIPHCKLTDLSLGGCYVQTESPFPERSGITLCLKAEDIEVDAEGMVRVMHPGCGMGIEFASKTAEEKAQVANFIAFLTSRPGATPELFATPRALVVNHGLTSNPAEELEDPLLGLLRRHESLSQDEFLHELQSQRG
jgi:CheY-like chemotaxis protein